MQNKDNEKIKKIKETEATTDSDRQLLTMIDRYGIMRATDLAIISGYNTSKNVRARMLRLCRCGYAISVLVSHDKCYYLTARGKAEIDRQRSDTFRVTSHLYHYLACGRVAAYLYLNRDVAATQIISDRILKVRFPSPVYHAPDLAIGDTCIEVELHSKHLDDLRPNIKKNADSFSRQIWVYPRHLTSIKKNVTAIAQELGLSKDSITFMVYDDIEHEITTYFDEIKDGQKPKNTVKPNNPNIKAVAPKKQKSVLDKYAPTLLEPQETAPKAEEDEIDGTFFEQFIAEGSPRA